MADASQATTPAVEGNPVPEVPETQTPPADVNGTTEQEQTEEGAEQALEDQPFVVTIVLPHTTETLDIPVSPMEQIHEIRQSIIEHPIAIEFSCFHLEFNGKKINDFIQVSDVEGLENGAQLHLVEDPYTEKEARIHLIRIRELIGASGDRTDTVHGVLAGVSVHDDIVVENPDAPEAEVKEYDFQAPADLAILLPKETGPAPKTIKSISLSPWNPPPAYWRQKGHLLYLVVQTNEGEQHHVTAHAGGFFVNRCSNAKFDPLPKPAPKDCASHSLFTLLKKLSPSFEESFKKFQEFSSQKDPLATFQVGNTFPSAPWLVPSNNSSLTAHEADNTRSQETYLLGGAENVDSLRDWNEEFQSAKELPKETIQDRVFRERLLAKLFADYTDAAARGAVLVARGEVAPLNPTEDKDAQIFVYNNIFFSFGADGVGTFTSEGGDEAARVATGKDVIGVKLVNQLDIDGLYTPGTVVIDYLGKRIVGQSIVPGIFKQPEAGENQIHYGAVDGKDIVAADERFAPSFEKLATALRVKKHAVWDKENKRHDLEASVEMKGLLGTDGRKYVLDLYRITPLDIAWMEESGPEGSEYPHRMTVLRPELVEALAKQKTREYVQAELLKRGIIKKPEEKKEGDEATEEAKTEEAKTEEGEKSEEPKAEETKAEETEKTEEGAESTEVAEKKDEEAAKEDERIDISNFKFALNPDVFSGQVPQTEEEKAEMAQDEQDVRDACTYLRDSVIPALLNDLKESDISFPMDGRSLTRLLHRRGINMRYLGKLATLSEGTRVACFRELCVREMIARAFKHVAAKYLRYLPLPLTSACLAHLLNCFLGFGLNSSPTAEVDEELRKVFSDADYSFEKVTPESLREAMDQEILHRFRFTLEEGWFNQLQHVQMLREVSQKLGLQIQNKKYSFVATEGEAEPVAEKAAAPAPAPVEDGNKKKKKKKAARETSPVAAAPVVKVPHTFSPDDFVNVVPIVKDSTPRSALAEEALEAGRLSIYQNQKKLGEDLLLESLSLHEQIYGLVHPEVAQMYHTLSQLYYQLGQKDAAVELSRKAAIVAERTVGLDSSETVLNYLNLSLFLHQRGDSKQALLYARHALDLWKVIYGPDHPDTITTMNNYAVMLQSIKAYHESRRWFEESLRVCNKVFGEQTVHSATLLFQLAQALALDQDAKKAVDRMRESYNIFKTLLGPEDKNTKEAEHWLTQLTHNAVSVAKATKELQARRAKGGLGFSPRNATAGAAGIGSVVPSAVGVDNRNIDELVKFVENSDKKKGGKKSKGPSNPKKRGGKA
ncbi:clustered mitochondria-domain-containing protein [Sordaria brevicollis]|uniref:Clustered mitochondria protein homolog n=1 Tax=Sordaria brevicollis TaxID=83679 RepID=A0AAE0NV24_SORBR|nr:clustered mitochondria-domain-containing protein [Sordaria brevicollis]